MWLRTAEMPCKGIFTRPHVCAANPNYFDHHNCCMIFNWKICVKHEFASFWGGLLQNVGTVECEPSSCSYSNFSDTFKTLMAVVLEPWALFFSEDCHRNSKMQLFDNARDVRIAFWKMGFTIVSMQFQCSTVPVFW